MVDSESVVVADQGSDGVVVDAVVVPDGGGEGEQALGDAGLQAGAGAGAVAFQAEFVFGAPDDRVDPLSASAQVAVVVGFVAPVGADEVTAEREYPLLEVGTGEAFVGQDCAAGRLDAVEHLGGCFSLGCVGGGELEAV